VGDVQSLVQQQVQLTRNEIVTEVRRRAFGWAICGLGIAIAFLGGVVACLTASHLLHWGLSPQGTDPGSLPLWACYGIVSASMSLIGAGVVRIGYVKSRNVEAGVFSTELVRGNHNG